MTEKTLQERLRDDDEGDAYSALCHEAADRLDALEEENARLKEAHEDTCKELHRQQYRAMGAEAQLAQTREALRRSANVLSAVAGDIEDGHSLSSLRSKYLAALVNTRDDAVAVLTNASARKASTCKEGTGDSEVS